MTDPLDVNVLLHALPSLLPRSTSSPLPHPTDSLAALVHTIHTALDFRLVPSNPPQPHVEVPAVVSPEADFDDGASDTPTAVDAEEEGGVIEGQLGAGWNVRGEDSYVFEYRHGQSAMVFRVRVGRMGGRVQIDAMAENSAPTTVSIVLADLITPPAFPLPSSATASVTGSSSPEAPAKSVGFKSMEAVKTFVDQYKRDIISKLLPGLQKQGYTEVASTGSDPRNPPPSQPVRNAPLAQPQPLIDPLHPSRNPFNPASIGHRDLDPFSAMRPPGSFNPQSDGGGMYADFNHPIFESRRRGDPDLMGGPGGSMQPPGARWDPIGPGMGESGRFPGTGGNPLGGIGVGDPGFGDELPPPGEYGPDLSGMGGFGGIVGPGRGRLEGGRGRGGALGGGLGGLGGLGGGGRFGGGMGGGSGFGGLGGGGGMYM